VTIRWRRRPAAVAILAVCLLPGPAFAADWQPSERIAHYPITGASGIELYRSIGENGPEIGGGGLARRTIAVTEYDLKWRRDYRPERPASAQAGQDDKTSCVLAAATPILTITYRLPKPKGALPSSLREPWRIFADGIEAHERVHGAQIIAMTEAIITATVGLRVENDPDCKAIRDEVLVRVKAELAAYKARSRAFDAEEMADGGNVHRLVLGLVNGG
jgi:predicted secreted Zn-dependent protease